MWSVLENKIAIHVLGGSTKRETHTHAEREEQKKLIGKAVQFGRRKSQAKALLRGIK